MTSSILSPSLARHLGRRTPQQGRGIVLVTGASSGIGAATARVLADRGFHVLAGVRNLDDAAPLTAASGRVEPILLDITDPLAITALERRLAREPGGLAGLVNNAGTISVGAIELIAPERWKAVIDVNVLGTINITRAALPALLRGHGRVINVSSPTGRIALPMFGPYAVSKFALEAFNDTLRREVAHMGVRVICVTPGRILTPIFEKGIAEGAAMMDGASDDLHARYGAMAASAIQAGRDSLKTGHPPETAAVVIARALTVRRPKTRYLMGFENRMATVVSRLLPDRVLDAVLAKVASDDAYVHDPSVVQGEPDTSEPLLPEEGVTRPV